ncbi:MAG: Arc family DNA binding domain-containing protein [Pseudomonadales bacterium]|nr:Arc family DNA binding domain-containing protein [Pseudomonadales bacterium]MCP5356718.1 Arc family DNA binding domain-containing protein [Pseudomonadales bacterium]
MSSKKSYPLRISPAVIEAMQRWADDDLRSLNGQIEYVLRESLRRSGRLKTTVAAPVEEPGPESE